MRTFSYDKLVLLGHCQSGRNVVERLLKHTYPEYVLENHCFWYLYKEEKIDVDFIRFFSTKVPEGKILLSRCNIPRLLNEIKDSRVFDTWKFVRIDRLFQNTVSSGALIHDMSYLDSINWAHYQDSALNEFTERIKHKTIRVDFDLFYSNTVGVINKIFNFIEFDPPSKKTIEYYASEEVTFKFLKENKCELGNEMNLIDSPERKIVYKMIKEKLNERTT